MGYPVFPPYNVPRGIPGRAETKKTPSCIHTKFPNYIGGKVPSSTTIVVSVTRSALRLVNSSVICLILISSTSNAFERMSELNVRSVRETIRRERRDQSSSHDNTYFQPRMILRPASDWATFVPEDSRTQIHETQGPDQHSRSRRLHVSKRGKIPQRAPQISSQVSACTRRVTSPL